MDEEFDVIVVEAGAGGFSSALNCNRPGCQVVVLEKAPEAGGSGGHIVGQEASAADTTGAGDVFVAGMLAAWYRGHDWTTAGRVANVAGATATTKLGAAEGVREWEEVHRLATAPPQSLA